jgi:hypothetical protein
MISYAVGNETKIRFDYYPESYLRKYLKTGEIKKHPELRTVYQFWFNRNSYGAKITYDQNGLPTIL